MCQFTTSRRVLLVALAAITSCTAVADDGGGSPSSGDGETATNVQFDQVVPARQMILQRVEDRHGVLLGELADIVIDRSYGRVAFFAINSRRAPNTKPNNYFVPPVVVNKWTADGRLQLKVSMEEVEALREIVDPVPATFAEKETLRMLYDHFESKPYWTTKSDQQALHMITVDELDGRIVRDAEWNKLGRIEEILLAPQDKWKVAYLAVNELYADGKSPDRLAVPMAAFAVGTLSPTWLLEVPRNSELLQATFESGDWPLKIHRGWIEFTHVMYGENPLGGVQMINQNGNSN